MLIRLLEGLFRGDLQQDEQPSPKKEKKQDELRIIIPEQFRDDVENLKKYVGEANWKPGLEIELTLQELLSICARTRKRSDAYAKLITYMNNELQITLKIKKNGRK